MKKIYMILAAVSLLSLSLNAQDYFVAAPSSDANNKIHKAPQRIDLPAGQTLIGPYTTDDMDSGVGFGTTYNYAGANHYIGIMLEPSDFEQYLGRKIVAFRAGFFQENDITRLFVYQVKYYDDGTFSIGSGHELVINGGEIETYDAGWHTFPVSDDDPMELTLDEGFNRLLIGYQYHQYTTSGYNYPNGVYTSCSTEHQHFWKRGGGSYDWAKLGMPTSSTGYYALAMQLIVEDVEKTATPTISYTINPDGSTVTINVMGDGELHMYVDGNEVPFPYTVGRGTEDYDIIVTATAKEEGKLISDEAYQRITIPKAELPLSAEAHAVYVEGDVTGELTWTCDSPGEVHIYVDGREVTSPWYLERLEEDYDIVVRITNQEDGHAMSTTTQTITVHGRGNVTIDDTWTELPGTYNPGDVINWGKNIMFIDRFTQDTKVYDEIKTQYTYLLKENKTTDPKKTNPKDVQALKSKSRIQGFYTEEEVLADVDLNNPTVELGVLNANVKMELEHNTGIYYYTLDRALVHETSAGTYEELSELQRNLDGTYTEMGSFFTQENFDEFQGANKIITVDRLDDINVETGEHEVTKGTFGEDYINYVPVVWSFGFDRVNYANDKKNNSYGSPIWTASPGDVTVSSPMLERQAAKDGNGNWVSNPFTNWKDENNEDCSLYILTFDADGVLPNINNENFQNVEYEPYMFRVWVECDGLRNFIADPNANGYAVNDPTADRTSPRLIFEKKVDNTHLSVHKDADAVVPAYPIPDDPETKTNVAFGALDSSNKNFIIRFYYKVKDTAVPTEPENPEGGEGQKLRSNRDGDAMFYGVGDGFDPGESTGIVSHFYTGEVVGVTYVNTQGMQSDRPFSGLNIVITRYSDGSVRTEKVVR